ncbi:endosomal/prevacuolar sodium/hydrogen exchanger [Trichomonascus vanleenenianus]|uniref:bifunctional K:H/Na:H antiporter NHX1 n=1 Tax=Trichomonascus vanleenenianus TaxID=2268995 RepID=UPI003ECAA040
MSLKALEIAYSVLAKRGTTDADPDIDDGVTDPATEEVFASWAIFIIIALLIASLWTSYYLQQKKIQAIHETVLSIFAGMFVGLIIRVSPGHFIQQHVSFSYSYFFNLLLPPIILNSGYELHQANFFRNIGSILTFAFAGTFLAAVVLGILLYIWTAIGLEGIDISFVDAISVGATLSATDPVTILSIFNAYKVDPKLYTIIFGESLLNDAVCIVMFETAQKFTGESLKISSMFKGIGMFLMTFTISLLIGAITGIMTALVLKHSHVRRFPRIESCLVLLFAYASYFFSNGCHMSGIVSLLFCGITLKHYAYFNMSRRTQIAVKYIFQLLAQLSEQFIFVYLGLSLFTEEKLIFKPMLIIVTAMGICVSRWAAVFPLSRLINVVNRRVRAKSANNMPINDEIPQQYQMMLFWAGLRGAVGVALAAGLEGEHANSLRATVLVVVVLTVIVFGGTTARMLEILGIRTGVVEEAESDDEFDIEAIVGYNNSQARHSTGRTARVRRSSSYHDDHDDDSEFESDISDLPPMAGSRGRGNQNNMPLSSMGAGSSKSLTGLLSRSAEEHARWFQEFDEQVLKPVLLDSTPESKPHNSGAGTSSTNPNR